MRFVATILQLTLLCVGLVVQNRTAPVAVGEMAPDFTLESHQGKKITLSEAREKSPVVLVFYRGYW